MLLSREKKNMAKQREKYLKIQKKKKCFVRMLMLIFEIIPVKSH